jgi:Zn-dependent protease
VKEFLVRKEWPYIFFTGFSLLLILIGGPTGFGESKFSSETVFAHKLIALGGALILLLIIANNIKRFKLIKGAKASMIHLSAGVITVGLIGVFAIAFGAIIKIFPSYFF